MGSRLGRRVVHMANLPLKLILPPITTGSSNRVREFALKTIPCATKFEIKSVLRSLYGFDVDEVRTLNMEGKKKKRGGILLSQPDYKKAYVTLRSPLPFPSNAFPVPHVLEQRDIKLQNQKRNSQGRKPTVVEDNDRQRRRRHWMDRDDDRDDEELEVGRDRWDWERRGRTMAMEQKKREQRRGQRRDEETPSGVFPWTKMRTLKRW